MRRAHFAAWAPHCPVCERDRGTTPPLGLADGFSEYQDDVLAGILVCADAACRHEYPIVDGVPIIMAELRRHLGERAIELLLRDDLDPAILGLIGDALGPDCWFDVVRQGVSTYAWDAYADLDPLEGVGEPRPGAARRCLSALLDLARPWNATSARRVLDLGCAGGTNEFRSRGGRGRAGAWRGRQSRAPAARAPCGDHRGRFLCPAETRNRLR